MSDSGSLTYDNLIGGSDKALVTEKATVRVYESVARGTLMGRLTSTDKWQTLDEDSSSSFNKFGITTEAIDTTTGTEAVTDMFVEGKFSENNVIFPYGDTADDWRDKLDAVGIYLVKSISTAGV
jgi:hypothetical protein